MAIREIFKFWHEKGFTRNLEKMMLFLVYITETKDANPDTLNKLLEETKIDGGDIMQTLADRLRKEGEKKGKIEAALALIKRGINMDIIAEATGFPKKRIEKLAETVH